MRLIDAEKLFKEIMGVYNYEYSTASGDFDEFVTKVLPNILADAPIVEERKIGHWVVDNNYETYNGFGEVYKCDQCGYEIGWRDYSEIIKEIHASLEEMDEKQKRYYCPHCGAKMIY